MKYLLTSFFIFTLIFTVSAQYTVSGGNKSPYEYTEGLAGSGISKIYILNSFSGSSISYTSDAAVVRFYKYTNSLADKVLIPYTDISTTNSGNNTTYTINKLEDSKAYFAEINGVNNQIIWIIDYSKHLPKITSIEPTEDEYKCDEYLKILINKSDELSYYSTTGTKHSIQRKYRIEYTDVDGSSKEFKQINKTIGPMDIGTEVNIHTPLVDTQFTISGDQIAEHFGIDKTVTSKNYIATTTKAFIETEQINLDEESAELGGSAPAQINFFGFGNEPTAYFYTWYIYKFPETDSPIVRYTDKNIKYTFNESGTYKVVLEVADRSSTCADTTSIEFSISESDLKIPNILFLGGNSEEAQIFKVTHKSIVKFKCSIFNRWGNKLYEWTDPSKGWDGKYNGKFVNTGVYFYAIDALGSDGIKYKKAGDINVLRKK